MSTVGASAGALLLVTACTAGNQMAPDPEITPWPSPQPGRCGDPYPDQRASPYVLPYAIGRTFNVGQGNCTDESHDGDDAFAYDLDLPIGTPVVAARAGRVLAVEGRYRDGNRTPGEENYLTVGHDDGTVAEYFHLTYQGPGVAVGDQVQRGAVIARSGDTGDSTEPHLHFQVDACADCASMPITFRNTEAHPAGLAESHLYRAERY